MHKILLLDWDGVLYRGRYFSQIYSEEFGVDRSRMLDLLDVQKLQANIGKADLKDLLQKVLIDWKWPGNVDELVEYWLRSDSELAAETIEVINNARRRGLKVYMVSNQEKYRADHIWNTVGLKDYLDGKFFSCDIGFVKQDPNFFKEVLRNFPGVVPSEIICFDDSVSKTDSAKSVGIDARLFLDFSELVNFVDQYGK